MAYVMSSTNAKSDGAYFDTIRLVSQLSDGYGAGYQFRQEDDAESSDVAWCRKDSPFHEGDAMEQEQHLNSGDSFCNSIHESNFGSHVMDVIPNWNCVGWD